MKRKAKQPARMLDADDEKFIARFRAAADPTGEDMRRLFTAYVQHTPIKQVAETFERAHRGAKFSNTRPKGTPNKKTARIESQFDKLYAKNRDISAEEVRTLKAPSNIKKMSRSTFAEHWKKAKVRAAK